MNGSPVCHLGIDVEAGWRTSPFGTWNGGGHSTISGFSGFDLCLLAFLVGVHRQGSTVIRVTAKNKAQATLDCDWEGHGDDDKVSDCGWFVDGALLVPFTDKSVASGIVDKEKSRNPAVT